MTKHEAVEILKEVKTLDDSMYAYSQAYNDALEMAIEALKAQEPATVEPKRIELADETKAWLDTMDAVEALGNIADICIDWDGYRTADGLGGLVNEIWAYARYCAKKLNEAQEPVSVQKKPMEMVGLQTWDWACGNCGQTVLFSAKFCPWCGRKVKWE